MPSQELPSYKKANLQMVAYRRIHAALSNLLARFHLSTTQWIMLGLISESAAGLRITDMARALQVEMPLITTTAQSLISAGLMKSTAHLRDKRAKLLTLTPRGKDCVDEVELHLSLMMQKLEQGADAHEINTYFKLLQQLGKNASAVGLA